jgi:heme exporter protein A
MEGCRLSVNDLACRRGDRLLFSGLNFALEPGEALQIAGPNGTGKSSLLRILAGLLHPVAGTVERTGTVALLDERPALDEHLPLGRAFDFWKRIDGGGYGADELAALGLADLLDVPVRFLSTGQRKRAAFARLKAQGTPIWLLDEPLNGLDTAAAALLIEDAAVFCAGGGIAVIASHQPFALAGLEQLDLSGFAP